MSGISLALVTNSSKRNNSSAQQNPQAHAVYLFRKLSRLLRINRSAPDAKSVHQFRTTVRRVQTLALSLGQQDEKAFSKFDKILTELFERAGRVRDLDVQMDALKIIALPSVEDDQALLKNYLQRQRGKRQRKFSSLVEKELAKRLPKRQRRAKALLVDTAREPAFSAARRSAELRKVVMPFVEKLRANHFDVETLHELRLEIKKVRYAAEAAGDAGKELIPPLKPVQDAIGEWHDWLNLMETADEVLGPLPGHPLMTILRGKVRARFAAAIAAVKPLEQRLSEVVPLPDARKRPGPVLVRQRVMSAANAS